MKTLAEIETCTVERKLVDAHVRIEPGRYSLSHHWRDGIEQYANALERWAVDVHDFFRDHRHQDVNSVDVVREYRDMCSKCKQELEPVRYGVDPDDDCEQYTGCASCAARIVQ